MTTEILRYAEKYPGKYIMLTHQFSISENSARVYVAVQNGKHPADIKDLWVAWDPKTSYSVKNDQAKNVEEEYVKTIKCAGYIVYRQSLEHYEECYMFKVPERD